jgi:hypothetical protein
MPHLLSLENDRSILWSHLSFCFTVPIIPGGWAFLQNEIDFIRWWKKNQGSIAPFLRLAIESDDGQSGPLARDKTTFAFVMNYMTTAQHLEIDPLFWDRVPAVMYRNGEPVTFPNLHTLVTYEHPPNDRPNHYFHHTFSVLRRLAIVDNNMSFRDTTIPAQWSPLTHLSITTPIINFDFWVHLRSTAPCLQWVYIYFKYQTHFDADKFTNPITRTLPQLSTLFIESGSNNNCLISRLLIGLYLPALSNLSLSCDIREWWGHRGITDIHSVLKSAPALRNLTLRKSDSLSRTEIDYFTGTAVTPVGGVGPIWSCVPHLVHLQLELSIVHPGNKSDAEKELDIFARGVFFSNNRWLDLDNPTCPIKTITVIDHGLMSPLYQFECDAQFDSDLHRKTPSIRKCAGNASNIALHVISQPITNFAHSWKEWRLGD